MKRFTAVLLALFLGLGVPSCSEVETLDKKDRQQVEYLCRMVLLEHLLEVKPDALSAREWKTVLAEYRRAEAADARELERPVPEVPDHAGAVVDRLARRLRR
jgi:hypothetical protein